MSTNSTPAPAFATRLKALQDHYELSVKDFADRLGVSRETVYSWFKDDEAKPGALGAIAVNFPDVRMEWARTGMGAMLANGRVSEEERRRQAGRPKPSPEPLAEPGQVLVLVFEDASGQPVYGFDHTGRAVQLGKAIRARASAGTPAHAG